MDHNKIGRELTEFGQEEARLNAEETELTVQLGRNRLARRALSRRRCKFLREVACHPDAALDPDVSAKANEPKDD